MREIDVVASLAWPPSAAAAAPADRVTATRSGPVIEAALVRLRQAMDDETHHCEHCHIASHRSFNDWQLAEQIDGMLVKLRRWMGAVDPERSR